MALYFAPIRDGATRWQPETSALRAATTPSRAAASATDDFQQLFAGASNTATAAAAAASPTPAAASATNDFQQLFEGASNSAAGAAGPAASPNPAPAPIAGTSAAHPSTPPTPASSAPTAQSVFGDNPWVTDPTGTGPQGSFGFNPIFFGTESTADTVAQMVGGTVVSSNQILSAAGSPFTQSQPNEMVELPNGGLINPGLVASFFTHGYPVATVDQMIANEVAGATPVGV